MTELYEEPIAPSIQEVASLIRTRTRNGQTGMIEGTFNASTKPTANDVLAEIGDAVADVRNDIGTEEVPLAVIPQVRSLVALKTAMKIELSWFSEQIEANKSPYKAIEKEYDKKLARTMTAVERAIEGDSEDTEIELLPRFGFPDGSDPQGMIGWGTIWS